MKKYILIIVSTLITVCLGIFLGVYINNKDKTVEERYDNNIKEINIKEKNSEYSNTIQILNKEVKTTPNTLLIYKIFYTKCKHLINEYKDIDIGEVNLNKSEMMNLNRGWKIEDFSTERVIFFKEIDDFCDEHYKLKINNGKVYVYKISEDEKEKEYQETDITEEYLAEEDLLRLKEGILIYGKENLTSTIEDYE